MITFHSSFLNCYVKYNEWRKSLFDQPPKMCYLLNMKKQSEKFTREWFVEQGRLGGLRTKELHGLKHFRKLNEKRKKPVDNFKKVTK